MYVKHPKHPLSAELRKLADFADKHPPAIGRGLVDAIRRAADALDDEVVYNIQRLEAERVRTELLREHFAKIQRVVDEQSDDESLWFRAVYISEEILQQALRRLHAAVEGEDAGCT